LINPSTRALGQKIVFFQSVAEMALSMIFILCFRSAEDRMAAAYFPTTLAERGVTEAR
jgi:hypothetical protein